MPLTVITNIGTEATPEAKAAVLNAFPNAVEETGFISKVAAQLAELGIKKGNCIALTSSCRDEGSRILDAAILKEFGLTFTLHGLAGVPSGGKLAIVAGTHHSPQDDNGKERYVFFGFTHVGCDETGTLGKMRRPGRKAPSGACGALLYLTSEFEKNLEGPVEPNEDDVELFYLRKKIEAKNPKPDILDVTNTTLQVLNETIEDLIAKVVDKTKHDYALITGIQIHSGQNVYSEAYDPRKVSEFIVPSLAYAIVDGEKKELTV